MTDEPPAGARWVWVPDDAWRVPACGAGRCRFTVGPNLAQCGAPPVASLNRATRPRQRLWWDYCAEHMFGRLVLDGVVYTRRCELLPTDRVPD